MAENGQVAEQSESKEPGGDHIGLAGPLALNTVLKKTFAVIAGLLGVLAGIAVFTAPFAKTGSALISITLAALAAMMLVGVSFAVLYTYRHQKVTAPVGAVVVVGVLVMAVGAGIGYVVWHARSSPTISTGAHGLHTSASHSAAPKSSAPVASTSRPSATQPSAPTPASRTYSETAGGDIHTWADYVDAGGREGRMIPAFTPVEVICRVRGFKVQDGDTWWYRIASAPWDGRFYASADAFYNNGRTSGSLTGTPYADTRVPIC